MGEISLVHESGATPELEGTAACEFPASIGRLTPSLEGSVDSRGAAEGIADVEIAPRPTLSLPWEGTVDPDRAEADSSGSTVISGSTLDCAIRFTATH